VLNELYANLRKAAPVSLQASRVVVQRYRAWQPWLVDETTVDRAWVLQDRLPVQLLGCLDGGCRAATRLHLLLTEDLQHEQRVDACASSTPFSSAPNCWTRHA
jgi:hypothetical protein